MYNLITSIIPEPKFITVLNFGVVCALFDIAERIRVNDIVKNIYASKGSNYVLENIRERHGYLLIRPVAPPLMQFLKVWYLRSICQ